VHAQHFIGTGLIVHHSETLGLVAVDRNTVPISVGDVMLSFVAYPVEIPAEVRAALLFSGALGFLIAGSRLSFEVG
jgi:hypothetical protein